MSSVIWLIIQGLFHVYSVFCPIHHPWSSIISKHPHGKQPIIPNHPTIYHCWSPNHPPFLMTDHPTILHFWSSNHPSPLIFRKPTIHLSIHPSSMKIQPSIHLLWSSNHQFMISNYPLSLTIHMVNYTFIFPALPTSHPSYYHLWPSMGQHHWHVSIHPSALVIYMASHPSMLIIKPSTIEA